jgi:hypothetical protein
MFHREAEAAPALICGPAGLARLAAAMSAAVRPPRSIAASK